MSAEGHGPSTIAFDAADNLIFIVAGTSENFFKATAASGYSAITPFAPEVAQPRGLAADNTSGTIYKSNNSGVVSAFDASDGSFLYDFGYTGQESLRRVTVDEATGTVYVAGSGGVYVFGAPQSYGDATGTVNAATEVTEDSAELSATIADNNILPTNWSLQISADDGSTWSAVKSGRTAKSAAVAATGPGTGTLSVSGVGGTFTLSYEGKTDREPRLQRLGRHGADRSGRAFRRSARATSKSAAGSAARASTRSPSPAPWRAPTSAASPATPVCSSPPKRSRPAPKASIPTPTYLFRVVTNKGTGAATEVASSTGSFHTVAPPPVIGEVGAIQVQDTSARLVGTIDPRNSETGYVFEYGTTPALGFSTPPLAIGSGTEPITVSPVVGGLAKDTTYYFRLVATNLTGTVTSASKTLHTRTTPFPPANPGSCANEARARRTEHDLPAPLPRLRDGHPARQEPGRGKRPRRLRRRRSAGQLLARRLGGGLLRGLAVRRTAHPALRRLRPLRQPARSGRLEHRRPDTAPIAP